MTAKNAVIFLNCPLLPLLSCIVHGYHYPMNLDFYENYSWNIYLQFPVKWNAFSDRNGMLFSGLTEWLSDTNGMAQ